MIKNYKSCDKIYRIATKKPMVLPNGIHYEVEVKISAIKKANQRKVEH